MEKNSVKSTDIVDSVTFETNGTATTFYISVYSFMYSTFTLVTKVERESKSSGKVPINLQEGVSHKGHINNENSYDLYEAQIVN